MKDYYKLKLTGIDGTTFAVGDTEQELIDHYNWAADFCSRYVSKLSVNDIDNPEWVVKPGCFDDRGKSMRGVRSINNWDPVEFDSVEEMTAGVEGAGHILPVEGLVEGQDYEMAIDWDDFQGYLIDIAEGSSGKNSTSTQESDKDFFARLVDECERRILTDELSTWYDNGNYRE